VKAAFYFGGTELVGLAAAETVNPLKTLPKATKQVNKIKRRDEGGKTWKNSGTHSNPNPKREGRMKGKRGRSESDFRGLFVVNFLLLFFVIVFS
jgi:hypothetical protein